MPYGASYGRVRMERGDPFLGGLVKMVAGPILSAGKALIQGKSVRRAVAGSLGLGGVAAAIPRVVSKYAGPVAKSVGIGAAGAAAFEAGQKIGSMIDFPGFGGRKKHRSMNPTNVRALRRSLRRIDSFRKLVKRVDCLDPPRRATRRRSACKKCG